jgi:uncharacterized membrane protein YhhN
MKKIALLAFCVVSIGELIALITEIESVHVIFKPLIMVTLIVYYRSSVSDIDRSPSVLLAMFFSFAGDLLLMFESKNEIFFILGLVAFLLAHLFYIFAYRQHRSESHADQLQGVQKFRMAFPVILAGSGLVVVLYPVLGVLKIPVLIYAAVIVVMVLHALFRFGRTTASSFWMVFGGAVLFMISDSILAINKFLSPVSLAGVAIMSSYIAAQFLIVSGLIKHAVK